MLQLVKKFFRSRTSPGSDSCPERRALSRRLHRNKILGAGPMGLQIQTVSACNASCYFCPYLDSWHKEHPGRMEESLYRRIIDEVSPYQVSKFCPYLENEPLLDRKLFDRIEYGLSRLDYQVLELSTNAALLDARRIEDIVRLFVGVTHEIRISFHGIDQHSYGAIMGLDFDACLTNTLTLIETAQTHDLKIKIRGSGAPGLDNAGAPFWFDREQYLSFWNNLFERHNFRYKPDIDFFRYHDRAGAIKRNEVNFSKDYHRNLDDFYCERIDRWFHFLYTGELVLCCMDYHKSTVFGDISRQSLDEIYRSEKYKNIARMAIGIDRSCDDFICKKCISPGG